MVKIQPSSGMYIKKLVLSAMFVAIGFVLPFFTGQIPQIGNLLQPMHIPVFLCALICGWQYGAAVGLVLPLLRSLIIGMPPIYPNALAMIAELAVYGFIAGFIYSRVKKQNVIMIYVSLLVAMVVGRAAWGAAEVLLLGIGENGFTWHMFITGAFINAVPGIIIQLILIPMLMAALNKTGLVPYKNDCER